jgi:glycosyltransferase involved in cell wall biosynthesis
VQRAIDCAARVITFSEHVANDQARRLFNVAPEKFRVIPMAPPDLAPLLPFVRDRQRTPESVQQAAAILRQHADQSGLSYLRNFPFEERKFIVVSTQNRTSKNLVCAAEAVRLLIREEKRDIKLITTSSIEYKAQWTLFPRLVEEQNLFVDVIAMHDLPRDVHAALYHCAEAAIHPSLFEGGLGVFPFFEAVSLGVPCAMALGPHVDEFLQRQPDVAPEVFDANDPNELAQLIIRIMNDRESILRRQRAVYEAFNRRDWVDVAEEYGQTVVGASHPSAAAAAAR